MSSIALAPRRARHASRLAQFLVERFEPATSLPLIVAFAACGYLGAAAARREIAFDPLAFSGLAVAVTLAFVHLRAADDLKDEAVDAVGRPERPLPRGLVTADEVRALALWCAGGQLVIAAALGRLAFIACLVALAFSLLAARDFFGERLIHRNLVVYALAHSPMVPLLLAFAWWSHPAAELSPAFASLLLLAWGLSLGLEVARKTLVPEEERAGVETYSRVLGQHGAVVLAGVCLALGGLGATAYAWASAAAGPVIGSLLLVSVGLATSSAVLGRVTRPSILRGGASLAALLFLGVPSVIALTSGSPL